jgi:hypothetical protein
MLLIGLSELWNAVIVSCRQFDVFFSSVAISSGATSILIIRVFLTQASLPSILLNNQYLLHECFIERWSLQISQWCFANISCHVTCFCHINYCWFNTFPVHSSLWIGLNRLAALFFSFVIRSERFTRTSHFSFFVIHFGTCSCSTGQPNRTFKKRIFSGF